MARKSAAAESVARPPSVKGPLAPPQELSVAERALWKEVVASKPVEWFGPDSVPVLKEYVRAAVTCDTLADRVVQALATGDENIIRSALGLRDKEAKRCADLATKLRLTQQSRYTPQAAATADQKASGGRPWHVSAA